MDRNVEYDGAFPAGLKILIVDDVRTCLFVLESMLRKFSYQVTKSQNARNALGLLRQHKNRFDLVMCNLHMPGMDGLKLLEIIRSEMDLPFVMMSSDDGKEAIMKCILDGACQYLVKPVKMEEARLIWQHVVRNRKRKHMLGDFQPPARSIYNTLLSQQAKDIAHQMPVARDKGEDEEEEEDNLREYSSDDVPNAKKRRVIWSIELHGVFVTAVNQLGHDKAVPKKILELMQAMDATGLCTGLSRANIASHLQKYRLHLRRGQPSSDTRDVNPLFEQGSSFGHQLNLQYQPTTGHQLPLQNLIMNQQPIRYQRAYEDLSAYHHDQVVSNIYGDSFVPELTYYQYQPAELSSHGTNLLFQNDVAVISDEEHLLNNVGDNVSELSNSISDVDDQLIIYEPSFSVRQYDQDQFFRGPFPNRWRFILRRRNIPHAVLN